MIPRLFLGFLAFTLAGCGSLCNKPEPVVAEASPFDALNAIDVEPIAEKTMDLGCIKLPFGCRFCLGATCDEIEMPFTRAGAYRQVMRPRARPAAPVIPESAPVDPCGGAEIVPGEGWVEVTAQSYDPPSVAPVFLSPIDDRCEECERILSGSASDAIENDNATAGITVDGDSAGVSATDERRYDYGVPPAYLR